MVDRAPCGRPPQPNCPHELWQRDPVQPQEIVRNGTRFGYQRYLCTVCKRVFREPSHDGSGRLSFREYRPLEALSVLAHGGNERRAYVAERLGVHRSRITQWEREYADRALALLEPSQVEDGRLTRRTSYFEWAPFTVAEADGEPFLKASFGELRFWVRELRLFSEAELERYADRLKSRDLSLSARCGILNELRAPLREAKPSLFAKLPS